MKHRRWSEDIATNKRAIPRRQNCAGNEHFDMRDKNAVHTRTVDENPREDQVLPITNKAGLFLGEFLNR